jgi:hypothetical protein
VRLPAVLGALSLACLAVAIGAALAARSSPTDPARLPVGDGKVSTSGPRRGWVYSCQAGNPGGGGAFRDGPWIKGDGTFDLTAKAHVDGSRIWPGRFRVKMGAKRVISGNGLPVKTPTGTFPVPSTDDAYQYDRNPNSIQAQSVRASLPAKPKAAARPSCLPMGPIGYAVNGVAIFNALDALGRDAVAHEVLDRCDGHPERSGTYHYHHIPDCLLKGASTKAPSKLVGWALDGYPIFGPRGARGKLFTDTDLDVCHGRVGWVVINRKRVRTYYYVATLEYPYTLGCFHGTPVTR